MQSNNAGAVVRSGLDTALENRPTGLFGPRFGVATHPAAVRANLQHAVDALLGAGLQVVALFGPEHGMAGAAAAGDHVENAVDRRSGIPVVSLYGRNRRPSAEQLSDLDGVLFDMQDAGVRFYTYLSTLRELLHACADARIPLWVLDRPNPLGGSALEGPILEPDLQSFVGAAAVPIRHGMTLGELALLLRARERPDAMVEVVRMSGWRRTMRFEDTGLPWVAPSPNLPQAGTAQIYPGTCLLEGTNLSCGRGTTLPFELCGAPWVDEYALAEQLNSLGMAGVYFRPTRFVPAADRFANQECGGVQAHIVNLDVFEPVRIGLQLVSALRWLFPQKFQWNVNHFDRLIGNAHTREAIDAGRAPDEIADTWHAACEAFRHERLPYMLYE